VRTTQQLLLALPLAMAGGPLAGRIAVSGSTTVCPVVSRAAELFNRSNPEVTFAVVPNGSGAGIRAAARGEVAIGMASRELGEAETKEFPDLVTTRIGSDAIALIVHSSNPVGGLSLEQLADLFTGKLQNWKEVGGLDAPVVLISSDKIHGTTESLTDHLQLESKQEGAEGKGRIFFAPRGSGAWSRVFAQVVKDPKDALAAVLSQTKAISFTPLPLARDALAKGGKLKILVIGGVAPTPRTVAEDQYPICRPLLLVTRGEPQGEVASFVQYLLGPAGQKLVASAGYVPN
jgi:phosphate transport system substrate-binding protein